MGRLVLAAVAAVIGFVLRRWIALAAAAGAWALFVLGLGLGWWGHGLGDAWQLSLVAGAASAAGGAAVGVALGRRIR